MPPINVRLNVNNNSLTATLSPFSTRVPSGSTNVTLEWVAVGGATFPEDAVQWKDTYSPAPPRVTNSQGATTITSEPYTNDFQNGATWGYTIQVQDGDLVVTIDPEVINEPPPGGEEDPKGKDKP